MVSNDLLNGIAEKAKENIDISNTHVDEEGLLVCNVCGVRKQKRMMFFEKERIVHCMCKCDVEEMEREKAREKEERIKANFKRRQALISSGYRDIYLADSDTPLPQIKNYIEKFEQLQEENIGLMIWGTVGNGKTFMASCIANELCKVGYRVMMLHITEALSNVAKFDSEYFKRELEDCDLLILDDFGVSRNTDYQLEQLNTLIDIRYSVKKPLVITTNMTREEIGNSNDIRLERTFNRLIEMTHPIYVEGESRRKKTSQERYKRIDDLLNG